MKKRILSLLLCATMALGIVPATAITTMAAEISEALSTTETLEDEYIRVSVSKKNGGFTITTVEGDRLKKSDNDKDLLYHDGRYDTSFLSFRVGNDESAVEYLFGGRYSGSSDVDVRKSTAGDSISAIWSVDGLTFTQTISLASQDSSESGMVAIHVDVTNESGSAVPVQARLLLDTCLGSQDYGYYQYTDADNDAQTVTSERIITDTDVPQTLYATDDPYAPSVVAYTIHTGAGLPSRIAFGHWSHLAATLFAFTPSETIDFTATRNEYATADSAYALYYDLGTVENGGTGTVDTYYGVRSNRNTPASDSVAVNVTAPIKLDLNTERNDYVRQSNVGSADFSAAIDFTNIASADAVELSDIRLAVTTSANLRSLSDKGEEIDGYSFGSGQMFTAAYTNVPIGETVAKTLYFEAQTVAEACYERVTIGVYDVSQTDGALSETYKLGETMFYVLLPGTDNDVPIVSFSAMSPDVVYTDGERHLYLAVKENETLINVDASARKWNLYAASCDYLKAIKIDHSNISFKDGVMDIVLTEKMKVGSWQLVLLWDESVVGTGAGKFIDEMYAVQTGPELRFNVSDDTHYKNDSYGLLVIAEFATESDKVAFGIDPQNARTYRILNFADENDFETYKADEKSYTTAQGDSYYQKYGECSEILFVIKGKFSVAKKAGATGSGSATYYTAVSAKKTNADGTTAVDNPILINNCLDFEDGTISIYYENYETNTFTDSAVCVEFDGKLYTNGARSSVWSGKGVFTKLTQNEKNYSLIPYNENGERISIHTEEGMQKAGDAAGFTDEAVLLIWPTLAGTIGQTISGMVFKLAYGQLGVMYATDTNKVIQKELGTVVSFGAELNLSFATGRGDAYHEMEENETYWKKLQLIWKDYRDDFSGYTYSEEVQARYRAYDWSMIDEGQDKTEKRVSGSVMVRDVLFGCGQGFVGVNFTVGVGLKNYISGLPNINGTLSINTINDWSFGVKGEVKLSMFTLKAEISFKSKDNVPVPDNLYVFVSGFEPGLNIDGCGVIWLTGGGGGINNLYNTIFCTDTVPPLKLLMSISFDVLKLWECDKATLSVGLTGVSLTATGIGIKGFNMKAVERMSLSLEWYPGINLQASIRVNLLSGVVQGSGYIVLISPDYKDVFFEMFARATLNVPASIPIVGGMKVAGVDLGISSEKVWGAVEVLSITLGATYYWGEGSVNFSSGSKTEPTFPELLGYEDIPVGYNEETDQTLYMRIGTNTSVIASNTDDERVAVLMSADGKAYLKSDSSKANHEFDLGTKQGNNDALVQITFDAESEAKAKEKAELITVKDDGENTYPLTRYSESENNASTANCNLSYDEKSGKATFAFSVTDKNHYNKIWRLTTPSGSSVLLYNVETMPEVTKVSGTINDGKINLSLEGNDLAELDQISFYLIDEESAKTDAESTVNGGYRIGVADSNLDSDVGITLDIPIDIPSGNYYVRAVYSKSDQVNGAVLSESMLSWTNSNTPNTVIINNAKPAGDLRYELTINEDNSADGYLVTVYDENGDVTDFDRVSYERAESGDTFLVVGGTYTSVTVDENGEKVTKEFGLVGGNTYTVGVTPYKAVTSGKGEITVYGKEVRTTALRLPEKVTPAVTFTADREAKNRTDTLYDKNDNIVGSTVKSVYTTDTLNLNARVSEAASGTWKLDGGSETTFENTETVSIALQNLEEGDHTLTVRGKATEDGDSFSTTYVFTVDTLPPQLILSSPLNGGFFGKDGTVVIAGITSPDAILTITVDEKTSCGGKTVKDLGGTIDADGVFSLRLQIPDPHSASEHTLSVSATDDVGNVGKTETVTLSHGGLTDIKRLEISVNGVRHTTDNIPIPAGGFQNAELALIGVTSDGKDEIEFTITEDTITWEIITVEGNASVDDGKWTADAHSQGVLIGKLAVASGVSQEMLSALSLTAENVTQNSYYRTSSICFGAYDTHAVSVSSTIGGTVSGGGRYNAGETVTLTATPNSGYRFGGWTLLGVTVSDLSATTITFTMPSSGNVTAKAQFSAAPVSVGGSAWYFDSDDEKDTDADGVSAKAGETVRVAIPNGLNENEYLPYYIDENGEKVFVTVSAAIDGYMTFIAPHDATYRFASNSVTFADIAERWSKDNIEFCTARGIFYGVGDDLFAPTSVLNRTMVITVLYRLASSPTVSGTIDYADIEDGYWYSDAVLWGKNTGIALGYDDGNFGVDKPITREQLCTMLKRFAEYMGFAVTETNEKTAFADEEEISDWAKEAVAFCQSAGLVYGFPNGTFCPQSETTREQFCAVIERLIRNVLTAK